jgi:hypothetical protein
MEGAFRSPEADAFAGNIILVVEAVRSSGVTDLRGIAEALNARGCL